MKRLEIAIPGVAVEAVLADASTVPLGVTVEFHPGIVPSMRQIALEAALRLWKREVGTVTRGKPPESIWNGFVWLRGWTIQPFQEEPVIELRIAYSDAPEEQEQAHG